MGGRDGLREAREEYRDEEGDGVRVYRGLREGKGAEKVLGRGKG